MDQLLHDARDHVVDGEGAFAATELGLEDHLQEQVSQLLADGLAVPGVDGVDDLTGLLERVLPERLEGLLAVPRAPIGFAKAFHDADQAFEAVSEVTHGARYSGRPARPRRWSPSSHLRT